MWEYIGTTLDPSVTSGCLLGKSSCSDAHGETSMTSTVISIHCWRKDGVYNVEPSSMHPTLVSHACWPCMCRRWGALPVARAISSTVCVGFVVKKQAQSTSRALILCCISLVEVPLPFALVARASWSLPCLAAA